MSIKPSLLNNAAIIGISKSKLQSESEIEREAIEAKEDAAIKIIQHTYKAYRIRKEFRYLLRHSFIKVYDTTFEQYVYKNKVSGNIFLAKPAFLGEEDLPVHRIFTAPSGYEPRPKRGGDGFALLITVTEFTSPKIPSLSEKLVADHKAFHETLTHDYLCRYDPDRVTSLINPKCNDIRKAFELIQRMAREKSDAFLLVYICTHVVTVFKGEEHKADKAQREKNCYFLAADAVWKAPKAVAQSSISLRDMAEMIKGVGVRATVLLNYGHAPLPKKTLFAATKMLYPPDDCITRLCSLSAAPVVASCITRNALADVVKHSPAQLSRAISALNPLDYLGVTSRDQTRVTIKSESAATDGNLEAYFRREWRIKADLPIENYEAPQRPSETWYRDYDGRIHVKLPTRGDVNAYHTKSATTGLMRLLKAPLNRAKAVMNERQRRTMAGPAQTSHLGESMSLFAAACIETLSGGACVPTQDTLPVTSFFRFMYRVMVQTIESLNAEEALDNAVAEKIFQLPVLCVPEIESEAGSYPVAYNCCEPPAPLPPEIVEVRAREVVLRWRMPEFDGMEPINFRVSMRNLTRNFHFWRTVEYKGIISSNSFTVRNMPSGVKSQFRVAAFNHGGWSIWSESTEYVCPGEKLAPLGFYSKWSRISEGGPLAVIDRMKAYPLVREDIQSGLRLLIAFGQKNDGFHKGKMQVIVAKTALDTLSTYKDDPEVLAQCFTVLGYAMRGKHFEAVEQDILNFGLPNITESCYQKFRNSTKVVGAIVFLQSCVSVDIQLISEQSNPRDTVESL